MVAGLVLAVLLLAAYFARGRGPAAGIVLAGVSLLWILVNHHMEGSVLVRFTVSRGLTEGDLVGVLGFALGAWQAVRTRPGSAAEGSCEPGHAR